MMEGLGLRPEQANTHTNGHSVHSGNTNAAPPLFDIKALVHHHIMLVRSHVEVVENVQQRIDPTSRAWHELGPLVEQTKQMHLNIDETLKITENLRLVVDGPTGLMTEAPPPLSDISPEDLRVIKDSLKFSESPQLQTKPDPEPVPAPTFDGFSFKLPASNHNDPNAWYTSNGHLKDIPFQSEQLDSQTRAMSDLETAQMPENIKLEQAEGKDNDIPLSTQDENVEAKSTSVEDQPTDIASRTTPNHKEDASLSPASKKRKAENEMFIEDPSKKRKASETPEEGFSIDKAMAGGADDVKSNQGESRVSNDANEDLQQSTEIKDYRDEPVTHRYHNNAVAEGSEKKKKKKGVKTAKVLQTATVNNGIVNGDPQFAASVPPEETKKGKKRARESEGSTNLEVSATSKEEKKAKKLKRNFEDVENAKTRKDTIEDKEASDPGEENVEDKKASKSKEKVRDKVKLKSKKQKLQENDAPESKKQKSQDKETSKSIELDQPQHANDIEPSGDMNNKKRKGLKRPRESQDSVILELEGKKDDEGVEKPKKKKSKNKAEGGTEKRKSGAETEDTGMTAPTDHKKKKKRKAKMEGQPA